MSSIKKILLAFDFNSSTEPAIKKAEYLAKVLDAELTFVHAVEHIPYHPSLNYWHVIHDEIRPRLEEICRNCAEKGIKIGKPIIQEGRPYDVIQSSANELDIDLIVLGSGKPKLKDSILGTSTVKIVRAAHQKVCIVPSNEEKEKIHKILCALDLSLASNEVLEFASALSTGLGAELTILHVAPKSKKYPGLENWEMPVVDMDISTRGTVQSNFDVSEVDKRLQENMQTAFDEYLDKLIPDGVLYRKQLRQGLPDIEILNAVNADQYDLLIMGRVNQRGISRLLVGNITEKVMRRVPCSFLTVKHSDFGKSQVKSEEGQAINTLERAESPKIDEFVDKIEKCYNLGNQNLVSGATEKAIIEFKKCISMDRSFYGGYDALSRCYLELGDPIKAQEYSDLAKHHLRNHWQNRDPR